MENISTVNSTYINNNHDIVNTAGKKSEGNNSSLNPNVDNIVAEGGESFFRYLKSLGLSKESRLMVLSSNHHYFYDENELKGIRTLVNLKRLNLIRDLDDFLSNLFNILPPRANFIGCFSDANMMKENGNIPFYQSTRFLNRFINFLDYKTNYFMTRNGVIKLLGRHGFAIVDMSEINGITYFYAQAENKRAERRA